MNGFWRVRYVVLATAFAVTLSPAICGQVFSLDDNPSAPLTTPLPAPGATPFLPFGFGAENPFGTVAPPPGLAPSPSLFSPPAGIWLDGTLLETGVAVPAAPELHLAPTFDAATGLLHTHLDALSNNSMPDPPTPHNLLFSVDRVSAGVPGSHSFIEAGFSQQPGDIYVSSSMFASPSSFAGTLLPGIGFVAGPLNPPSPSTNRLLFNQSDFDLTARLPPGPGSAIPPFTPAPPIGPGTHDNVDAFELRALDIDGDFMADVDYYFSINPDDAVNKQFATFGAFPFDSADIRYAPAGAGGASFLFAGAVAMGLAPMPIVPFPPIMMANDIDGLVVWDVGGDGAAVPGVDFALFSLSPGSIDLATFGNSPADVFFTDFSGSYAVYASAIDLGLLPMDNIDALEIVLSGDTNLSGGVTGLDLAFLAANYNMLPPIETWTNGDFDGNGIVGLSDLVVLAGGFGTFTGAALDATLSAGQAVPEPTTATLILLASLVGLMGRRHRRLEAYSASTLLRFGPALCLLASLSTISNAASVSVTTRDVGGGLFQHRLTVTANDGDVRGFEILVEDSLGRINDIDVFGGAINTVFLDNTVLLPLVYGNPARDTHVLYNSSDGISIPGFTTDTVAEFAIATGVGPASPLVANGSSRDLFQLVTVGNIALPAANLRVNVGGGGGDQFFDGMLLQSQVGDYNRDGSVNATDYVVWRDTLGLVGAGLPANGDGNAGVDGPDFTVWSANFGAPAPGSSAIAVVTASVPEPTSWLLLAMTTAIAMHSRRPTRRRVTW